MLKYIFRRLLSIIPIVLGVAFITFTIISFTPGDPGHIILGSTASQEQVDLLNKQLGYDKPFLIRFVNYIVDAVTKFDFGNSYSNGKPVVEMISARFPTTLILAVLAVFFSGLFGIPMGIFSAIKQNSIVDSSITFIALFLASVPGFWLGLMLIRLFALKLGILPTSGLETWAGFILPIITLSLPGSAGIMRMTRTTLLETIRQDYVRTARSKGAPERTVIINHALKNAILPIITSLGLSFGGLLGGTVIVESVFGVPGLGTLVINAIRMKDIPMVLATTIFLATIFCMIILVIDIMYMFFDPRIKARFSLKG